MLARHKVLLTSSISLRLRRQPPRSANCASLFLTFNFKLSTSRFPKFFPCHTSENSSVSPAIATDPKMPSRKPFACHTSETPRAGSQHSNLQPSNIQTIPQIYPLSFHILAHSFALFCTHQKPNSFIFIQFRTLRTKTKLGGAGAPHRLNSPFPSSNASCPSVWFFHGSRNTGHGSPVTSSRAALRTRRPAPRRPQRGIRGVQALGQLRSRPIRAHDQSRRFRQRPRPRRSPPSRDEPGGAAATNFSETVGQTFLSVRLCSPQKVRRARIPVRQEKLSCQKCSHKTEYFPVATARAGRTICLC